MVNTRPDICFVVNTLNQFMVEPRSVHWIGEKHVLRYIAGSVDFGLDYVRGDGVSLVGYVIALFVLAQSPGQVDARLA
jgi:hypothetical protein